MNANFFRCFFRTLAALAFAAAFAYCSSPMTRSEMSGGRGAPAQVAMADGSVEQDGATGGIAGPAERKLVRTAQTSLVVPEGEITPGIEKVRALTLELKGYVFAETKYSITVKVPNTDFDSALGKIETFGEVRERSVNIEDITARYVDVSVRITNLRKTRERLQELFSRATKVEDILNIERELNRVTSELESLEAQMRTMDNQVAYSTIHVYFIAAEKETRPGPLGWALYGAYRAVRWLFIWD